MSGSLRRPASGVRRGGGGKRGWEGGDSPGEPDRRDFRALIRSVIGFLIFLLLLFFIGFAFWLALSVFFLILAVWLCWVTIKVIVKAVLFLFSARD